MLHSTKVKDQRIDDTNTITFLYFFIFLILKQFEIITGVYFGRYSNYCGTTSMKALETLIGLPKILDQWRSRKLDGLFYSKFVNYPRIGWSSNLGLNNITENGWLRFSEVKIINWIFRFIYFDKSLYRSKNNC